MRDKLALLNGFNNAIEFKKFIYQLTVNGVPILCFENLPDAVLFAEKFYKCDFLIIPIEVYKWRGN